MSDARRSAGPSLRQLLPFGALSASYFAHIGFFNPYLPLWLKELGLPLVAISLLTSAQSATRLFAPYAWGALSDRLGERVRLMRYSASVALVLSLGLWRDSPSVLWLAGVLLLMFSHTSAMMPMSEAAMAHLVSQGGQFDARRYGRVRLCGSLGFLLTVFLAGSWFEQRGMHDFPAWTVLTLLAVVGSTWCLPDQREAKPTTRHEHLSVGPVLRQPEVRWFFLSLFFHVLAHVSLYVFFSLYLDSLGYSKAVIGLLWAVSVIVEVVWFFTQSRWLPALPLTGWLALCGAAMALRMGLTAWGAGSLLLLLALQCLHALTFAAHHTVCIALISHYFPARLRGRGQALFTVIGYGVSGVLGGLGGGYLAKGWGLVSVYWAAGGAALLATACALSLWHLARPRAGLT
ncbi:MFS transporter [Curvibacter sp. HBC28]|uniref:MFS transporter n=1 Tax=Curvibacter microcysteis TaxID=3026419 RepID=A0ABT5ME22_9BURK|nr:MFS transporter [Curvibacter sp. HBC28]MDD0814234.1 MFS transporter [Curvibacter sp. HBC28]